MKNGGGTVDGSGAEVGAVVVLGGDVGNRLVGPISTEKGIWSASAPFANCPPVFSGQGGSFQTHFRWVWVTVDVISALAGLLAALARLVVTTIPFLPLAWTPTACRFPMFSLGSFFFVLVHGYRVCRGRTFSLTKPAC